LRRDRGDEGLSGLLGRVPRARGRLHAGRPAHLVAGGARVDRAHAADVRGPVPRLRPRSARRALLYTPILTGCARIAFARTLFVGYPRVAGYVAARSGAGRVEGERARGATARPPPSCESGRPRSAIAASARRPARTRRSARAGRAGRADRGLHAAAQRVARGPP